VRKGVDLQQRTSPTRSLSLSPTVSDLYLDPYLCRNVALNIFIQPASAFCLCANKSLYFRVLYSSLIFSCLVEIKQRGCSLLKPRVIGLNENFKETSYFVQVECAKESNFLRVIQDFLSWIIVVICITLRMIMLILKFYENLTNWWLKAINNL
jgi:hypothetical protein